MRLVQFEDPNSRLRKVGLVNENEVMLSVLDGVQRVYELAIEAEKLGTSLKDVVTTHLTNATIDYDQIVRENCLFPPLDHPDPAHEVISGTGLTHSERGAVDQCEYDNDLTDLHKLSLLGIRHGKPQPGQIGVQSEWFYKGDGDWIVRPGHGLDLPPFASGGGEEPEIVGLYVIGKSGNILRIGFALGNEFSDHAMEEENSLYSSHSKLRNTSFGPELLIGELPDNIVGRSRILRNNKEIWSSEFLTGEANMSHSIRNLEYHHFKYSGFRRPGDVHCHFFGTATLSFEAGIQLLSGDVFEISAPPFGKPLINQLMTKHTAPEVVTVNSL